jgi:steroid delta-isomerase-like uncharacterized protein
MNPEELKALLRLFYEEVWNKGNLGALEVFLESDFVFHNPTFPETGNDIEGYRQIVLTLRTAFPDQHWTLQDVLVDGDRVVTRWTMHGTHTGTYMGIEPSGKSVTFSGISINRIVGSRIAEQWVVSDALGFLLQEGYLPIYQPTPAVKP